MKIRFSTPYLVYKIKPFWNILDKLSQLTFVIISILIIILAEYWQISFAMLFNIACFVSLCLALSVKLYNMRKQERQLYKGKAFLTMEDVGHFWKKYKRLVNQTQVKIREKIWFVQFIFVILCVAIIYPTEFLYTLRE